MPRPRSNYAINRRELERAKTKLDGFMENIAKVAYTYDQHKGYQLQTMGVVSEHTERMLEASDLLADGARNMNLIIDMMLQDMAKE